MNIRSSKFLPSAAVSLIGVLVLTIAAVHHIREYYALNQTLLPGLAFALDGLPALLFVIGGYKLYQTNFSPSEQWRVFGYCIAGGSLFAGVIGLTILIRVMEGKPMPEPIFPMLLAGNAGAIAGGLTGYFNIKAKGDAERAEKATEALATVNHVIRHDLRNDLNIIQGYAELIKSDYSWANSEIKGNLEDITKRTQKAADRLDDTRSIAEALSGDEKVKKVNLSKTIRQSVKKHRDTFDGEITTQIPEKIFVKANDGISSAIGNLIENAVDHNDSEEPEITISLEKQEETVKLEIKDNGPGISEKYREAINGEGENDVEYGGLFIASTLINGYGGEMTIKERDLKGTKVEINLPQAEVK